MDKLDIQIYLSLNLDIPPDPWENIYYVSFGVVNVVPAPRTLSKSTNESDTLQFSLMNKSKLAYISPFVNELMF